MYYLVKTPRAVILNNKFDVVLKKLQSEYKDYIHECVVKMMYKQQPIAEFQLFRYCLAMNDYDFVKKVKHLKPTRMDCVAINTKNNRSMLIGRLQTICKMFEKINNLDEYSSKYIEDLLI